MRLKVFSAQCVLRRVEKPIRIPTATWLLSDVLNIIDIEARMTISWLIDHGYLKCTSGGWLEVVPNNTLGVEKRS